MSAIHTYTLDCKFFASIDVKAETVAKARAKIAKMLSECDANLGNIDGDPIVVSLDHDGEDDLTAVDGEDA